MKITRIKAPVFFVEGHKLNEYEARQLQYEVASGEKPSGIEISDEYGVKAIIKSDGGLSFTNGNSFKGFAIASDILKELFSIVE